MVFIGGLVIGVLLFTEGYPLLEGFYKANFMGTVRISEFFGISSGGMVLIVIFAAIAMFWIGEWAEKTFPREEY